MCLDPGTLTAIGTFISVAGSAVSGVQAYQQGQAQKQAYERQAQADAQAAAYEATQEKRRQDLLAANARAQVGASGVGFEGSPSEVLAANSRFGQMDVMAIQYGSSLRQGNYRTQGDIAAWSGTQQAVGSVFKAGSNLVSGLSNMYDPNRAVQFGRSVFS